MKHILTTAILATIAFAAQADERTIPEKVRNAAGNIVEKTKEAAHDTKDVIVGTAHRVGRATRVLWLKTTAYLGDDMPVYQQGAAATLAGLGAEIAELKAQTPAGAPAYFRTRLLALDQQHEHLQKGLAVLSHDELRDRSAGARYYFDRSVADLEQAIDQAVNGAEMFSKIAVK